MTLSASTAQMADPPVMLFDRLALTRSFLLVDAAATFPVAYAAGVADGLTRGLVLGRRLQDAEVEEALAAGASSGIGAGMAIGRFLDGDDAADEAFADAFPLAFAADVAAAPTPTAETDPPELGTPVPTPDTAPGDPGGFPSEFSSAKNTPIVLPVVDDVSDIGLVVLLARFGGGGDWVGVYAGRPGVDGAAGWRTGYEAFSSLTGDGSPGVGFTFSIRRDDGWPARNGLATTIEIDTKATDTKGNVLA